MKKAILTNKAPLPIGPYNQAINYENMLFVSGQIPLDPDSNELVNTGIEDETNQVMKNIQAILTEAGMSFDDIVKTSIFLKDMDNFKIVNEMYGNYFKNIIPPARETVQVSKLPLDVNVEISCIAIRK
ncbi:MAG: reactive intermediate/imine deaminase [Marinoscillum sp.]|jgi:2-iminobutanoate/2-iminopropanoate deaminase|nr:reactive intermediate/imine deaminase [Marinoscillum sp.]OUX27032.1 MAG: reactive intermediate/imine deaminase [Flammeovirgaceae bacterium TMED262]|tara:strand:+ start:12070 stop:12453 length:384 start_codon:yes stop_codon:yes gene_type:complete